MLTITKEKFRGLDIYCAKDGSETIFKFIRFKETQGLDVQEFMEFMNGQTMPYLAKYPDAVYLQDYLSYLRVKEGKPIVWD